MQRNAVISGISQLLIAAESSYSGGTRWQVELAVGQGRTVIAIEPERSNELAYDGYKKFIEHGAISASTVDQILKIVQNEVQLKEQTIEDELEELELIDDNAKVSFSQWEDKRPLV